MATTQASAHCYSRWYYPEPQAGCGSPRHMRHAAPLLRQTDRDWYVEIIRLPPDEEELARRGAIDRLKGILPQ